ncbi:hypothetical protein CAC42_5617 [Sphaceloma murrayae]|uniref:PH domain-containing protein n=1 Tax=Sphaceloma murrayae TaxID=2082308 RepID=A0A2K1QYQ9_9PEZI|nr:hypothetical protein CAC42_5617 [Sphaceloma murrayae]
MDQDEPPSLRPVDRPLDLIPVGLKEAALDSPTFRATTVHFADQVDLVEKWLEGFVKAGMKLSADVLLLENSINSWLQQTSPPSQVTEAIIDHDYTLLATRRYAEAAREVWQGMFRGLKKSEKNVIEPIKGFLNSDLRLFKDARRHLEASQRGFDTVLSRYASQPKTKEASALREDAFQLHEARKAYLKASLDFCTQGPTLRASLDKLIVKIFADQWRDFKGARDENTVAFTKFASEMDRIRGWGREMENSERAFKRELLMARRQIEESAEIASRPSRELDDYAEKTAPFLGSNITSSQRPEKQGWLFLKSVTGKPARTLWSRRWFFVKNGIFGWLVQGLRSGGVEESEKIGLLLCSTRSALQEERRFCFEVKTKDTTIILQAESQNDLNHWIDAFDLAKRKALDDPKSIDSPTTTNADAAFAISPPIAPEFAAKVDGHLSHGSEEQHGQMLPETNPAASRSSFDVSSPRRVVTNDMEHGGRIMGKLDMHRKATPSPQVGSGIASLISSSHNVLPVGPVSPPTSSHESRASLFALAAATSLAPSTLANPPAPTSLSKTAVVVSGERGLRIGQPDGSGMPGGIMSNFWGSEKWGTVNRLERDGIRTPRRVASAPITPELPAIETKAADDVGVMDGQGEAQRQFSAIYQQPGGSPMRSSHRKAMSIHADTMIAPPPVTLQEEGFPKNYPLALRAQDAQFRILFPDVSRSEKVVLVFRATWNPNEEQEFPGRVFITTQEIYFFSHHLGFVLISGVSMDTITEITAAPGRDCDFLFMHLDDARGSTNGKGHNKPEDLRRVTIKTFLEPLKLLQRRLNYLVQNANSASPAGLEEVMKTLLNMEKTEQVASGDNESWDMVNSSGEEEEQRLPRRREHDIKPSLRIDGNLYGDPISKTGREVTRFKLPSQPVNYTPPNVGPAAVTKDFTTSAKALFHVMFGDKSAVFQQLYRNRGANEIVQSSWNHSEEAHSKRTLNVMFDCGKLIESQTIDVQNDHLCYVVTATQVPFNFPLSDRFFFMTKFVITHSAKSQSRFAIFNRIIWAHDPPLARAKGLIERRAQLHLNYDANELMNLAMDQVVKLGARSKTSKAIHIFGHIGQATQPVHLKGSDLPQQPSVLEHMRLRRYTLPSLWIQEVLDSIVKVVSVVFDFVDASVKSIMSIASAHTLLILLLAVSVTFNSWHSYRDGITWWHEREATKFMARLGVKNDDTITRTIYLGDYKDLIHQPAVVNFTAGSDMAGGAASCRTTFHEVLTSQDTSTTSPSKRAESRIHGTRKTLARYRHDLLVALRVVNRVEKEVVQSAWEDWLTEETGRCDKMKKLLGEGQRDNTEGKEKDKRWTKVDEELERYCTGCRTELEALGARD